MPGSQTHASPTHLLLHLSDTHLVGGGLLYGSVDSRARLLQLLEENRASGTVPDAVVVTGDLADTGEAAAYRELKAALRPFAENGSRVIWLMGNHDDRTNFRREILGDDDDRMAVYGAHRLGGLRIITLDTSVRGFHHGDIDDAQLDWLSRELDEQAPEGTVVAMHHPPVPLVQPVAHPTGLRNTQALADVLSGSDVRLILAGHLHTSTQSMFAGIPVSVASATSYTQDTNVASGGSRGRDGAQSVTLVHVYESNIVTTVSPIGVYDTVGAHLSPQEVSRRLQRPAPRASRSA
jgi:Icc protein